MRIAGKLGIRLAVLVIVAYLGSGYVMSLATFKWRGQPGYSDG